MSKISDETRAEVLKAISEHLLVTGPGDWDSLRNRYPEVSRATFFRWVEQCKRNIEASANSPGALRVAQQRVRSTVMPAEQSQEEIAKHVPSAPSPAVVAGMGGQKAAQVFDFLAHFKGIVDDAELMRESLVAIDPETGKRKVKNPVMLDKNIARRLQIGQNYLEAMQLLYNQERIRELYQIVIQAVGQADPATQQAILAKLREANNKHGITLAAELG